MIEIKKYKIYEQLTSIPNLPLCILSKGEDIKGKKCLRKVTRSAIL